VADLKRARRVLKDSAVKYLKETAFIRLFGLIKIPLLAFISPTVVELTEETCAIKVPLNWRTKNHLGSMYFGVLSAGADVAGGLIAMRLIQQSPHKVALVFKDFYANFKKRATGDVIFRCDQGEKINELVQRTIESGEREEMSVNVTATVPTMDDEVVADFVLTLSLKKQS
jgi:acyl-coenzyme A thioesterase PaaI-like protein